MKRLSEARSKDDKAILEVIECNCGYHMGIDATWLEEHPEAFFDEPATCHNCGIEIPVRELLELEDIEVVIPVTRIAYAHSQEVVTAGNIEDAKAIAEQQAADKVMSEKSSEYETNEAWWMKP